MLPTLLVHAFEYLAMAILISPGLFSRCLCTSIRLGYLQLESIMDKFALLKS